MVVIGIYGCSFNESGTGPLVSRQCYSLVSFAAVAEWIISICWVGAMVTTGYEILHVRQWCVEMREAKPPPQKGKKTGKWRLLGCCSCCGKRRKQQGGGKRVGVGSWRSDEMRMLDVETSYSGR